MYSSRLGTPADVDQRGRQEAAHAQVDDQAALDDLDDSALDRLAGTRLRFLCVAMPSPKRARFFDMIRATVLVPPWS